MSHRDIAVSAAVDRGITIEGFYKFINDIIYIYKVHYCVSVVYLYRQSVCDVVAKSCYCAVVVRSAPGKR